MLSELILQFTMLKSRADHQKIFLSHPNLNLRVRFSRGAYLFRIGVGSIVLVAVLDGVDVVLDHGVAVVVVVLHRVHALVFEATVAHE